jgi:hypothetical protein
LGKMNQADLLARDIMDDGAAALDVFFGRVLLVWER